MTRDDLDLQKYYYDASSFPCVNTLTSNSCADNTTGAMFMN